MYSLTMLQVTIDVGLAVLCTLLAVAGGAMVAWKFGQENMSESEIALAHETYMATQYKLAKVRARRMSVSSADAETRRMNDDTVPDVRIVQTFAVVPMRTVTVGSVRQLSSLVVG